MAHRALVAYETTPDRYDVHTSRWGGLDCGLARSLTPEDPFADGAVDPEPNVRNRDFEAVLTMVDPARHEALYRVESDHSVRTYCVLWLELGHYVGQSGDADPSGLLVAVDSPGDAAAIRRWLRAVKGVLADAIDGGYLTLADAQTVLTEAADRRTAGRETLETGVNE